MMDKFTITELAEVLIRKNGLSENEAQAFVAAIFDIVKEGLDTDKIVKVKGFGTFKIIEVDPRESVNVNTGERVLIDGHQKITFTPDSVMKELVNRPFSQFETVILNEGVDFSEVDKSSLDQSTEEDDDANAELEEYTSATKTQKEKVEEEIRDEEIKVAEEEKDIEEEKDVEVEKDVKVEKVAEIGKDAVEENVAEVEKDVVEEKIAEEEAEECNEEETNNKRLYIFSLIIGLIVIVGVGYGSYKFGYEEGRHQYVLEQIAEQSDMLDKQKEQTAAQNQKQKADTIVINTVKATATVTEKAKSDETAKPQETKNEEATSTDFSTYAMRDVRVRTGAYTIIGIDKVVVAREGQTVGKIAQSHLGPGMSCYVEVVNGMNENEPLKEGTKVKIPKLRHKKAKK